MRDATDQTARFFIECAAGSCLVSELRRLGREGFATIEHPNMECLDRQGNQVQRDLWETPAGLRDRLISIAKKRGIGFALYQAKLGGLPQNYFVQFPLRRDPFKEARLARKAQARRKD